MLSKRIINYLDGLVKIAEGQDYKIESITFYNTYADIPEKEKNEDTLQEMEEYLNGKNIEILSDGIVRKHRNCWTRRLRLRVISMESGKGSITVFRSITATVTMDTRITSWAYI